MTKLGLAESRGVREEFLNFCREQPAPLADSRFAVEGKRCSFWLGTLCELSKSLELSTRLYRPTDNEARALCLDKYRVDYKKFLKANGSAKQQKTKESPTEKSTGSGPDFTATARQKAGGVAQLLDGKPFAQTQLTKALLEKGIASTVLAPDGSLAAGAAPKVCEL